jgi:hypothetical protein
MERARLVWTNLAAKFTECAWSLEAMVTMGGDLQPGCLADRLLGGKLLNSVN